MHFRSQPEKRQIDAGLELDGMLDLSELVASQQRFGARYEALSGSLARAIRLASSSGRTSRSPNWIKKVKFLANNINSR